MAYHLKPAAGTLYPKSAHPPYRGKPHVALRQVSITGQRYYSPGMGRWTRRDPLGELLAISLYVAIENSGINEVDFIGLCEVEVSGFAEGGEWKLINIRLLFGTDSDGAGAGDHIAFGSEIQGVWNATCLVKCECDDEERSAEKVFLRSIRYDWELGGDPGKGPMDLPKPKGWWEALLELIKKIFEDRGSQDWYDLPPEFAPPGMEERLEKVQPDACSEGSWKDGCPCPTEGE